MARDRRLSPGRAWPLARAEIGRRGCYVIAGDRRRARTVRQVTERTAFPSSDGTLATRLVNGYQVEVDERIAKAARQN